MNLLENLKIVLTIIMVENFFYKYYIGVNFFTELHKEDIKKEKIAIDFSAILGVSSVILFLLKKFYHQFTGSNAGYLILMILSTYFTVFIYNRIIHSLEKNLYFSVNNFLLLAIIENRFDTYTAKILAIILIPLFYYFNLVVLEPLLKSLNYKITSKYVKKEALIIVVIGIAGLLLSAFEWF